MKGGKMQKKRRIKRTRKSEVEKIVAKREPCIVSSGPRCPRCSEETAIILERTFTSGIKRYLCVSETCKQNSIRGKGRRFVVPPGKCNCKKI